MVIIQEIPVARINDFWNIQFQYLVDDGMITEDEEKAYYQSAEYRDVLKGHMLREQDKLHMAYFVRDGVRIGATQYCTYQSEDGKCFILDFWVFPEYRGNGTGHECFMALLECTKNDGAKYYALNYAKEDSRRFWLSLGFIDNGVDEYGSPLMKKESTNM